MDHRAYGIRRELDLPYEAAIGAVTETLKAQGFGVLTEIDVQTTLKKKIDVDVEPYVILGACNPHLAHEALRIEPEIGLLLPCNVIVYPRGGGSVVSVIDPGLMLGVAANPDLAPVAEEARTRLLAALDALPDGG